MKICSNTLLFRCYTFVLGSLLLEERSPNLSYITFINPKGLASGKDLRTKSKVPSSSHSKGPLKVCSVINLVEVQARWPRHTVIQKNHPHNFSSSSKLISTQIIQIQQKLIHIEQSKTVTKNSETPRTS